MIQGGIHTYMTLYTKLVLVRGNSWVLNFFYHIGGPFGIILTPSSSDFNTEKSIRA